MIRHLPYVRTALLAVLVLIAPLPFAGVTPLSRTLLVVAAFGCLAVALSASRSLGRLSPLRPTLLCFVAVPFLGFLQTAPWPAGWVARLSPQHAALQERSSETLTALADTVATQGGENQAAATLSLAPSTSFSTALLWLAAASVLAAAAINCQSRTRRHVLAAAVISVGLFQVVYGAQQWFARSREIWGVAVPGDPGRLRGTFVNSNHLALYLELALALTFAWGWWAFLRASREVDWNQRLLMTALPVVLWLTLFAGLAFTGSRSGLLAAVGGTAVQGLVAAGVSRRRWLPAVLGVGVGLLGLGVVALVGFEEGLGRWTATSVYEVAWSDRLAVYRACLDLFPRFPLFGTGLGTFREAFELVEPEGLQASWHHAHNDYLELLVTTGTVGVLLVAGGLFSLLRRLGRVLSRGRRSADRGAALAALGALAQVGIHSAFDFGLTMPANALTLAVVCGGAAAVPLRGESPRPPRR